MASRSSGAGPVEIQGQPQGNKLCPGHGCDAVTAFRRYFDPATRGDGFVRAGGSPNRPGLSPNFPEAGGFGKE